MCWVLHGYGMPKDEIGGWSRYLRPASGSLSPDATSVPRSILEVQIHEDQINHPQEIRAMSFPGLKDILAYSFILLSHATLMGIQSQRFRTSQKICTGKEIYTMKEINRL